MTLEQQLADIKERKGQKELELARIEAQAESARDQVREASELLLDMGFKNTDEARARIKQLEKLIEDRLEEIRRIL